MGKEEIKIGLRGGQSKQTPKKNKIKDVHVFTVAFVLSHTAQIAPMAMWEGDLFWISFFFLCVEGWRLEVRGWTERGRRTNTEVLVPEILFPSHGHG